MSSDKDELITDYLAGNCTPEQEEQMVELMKEDPSFKVKLAEMARTRSYAMTHSFIAQKQRNFNFLLSKLTDTTKSNKRISIRVFLRYAAVIIFIISSNIILHQLLTTKIQKDLESTVTTTVPYGSISKLILPDSSEVWINAGSTITYQAGFGITNRNVRLTGEARFSVRKNSELPFHVNTNHLNVTVTGTQFNIKAYPEESESTVELTEGKVILGLPSLESGTKIEMKPNERVIVNHQSLDIQKDEFNTTRSSGWIEGEIEFTDESFSVIALMLERKFNIKIRIDSETLANERFTSTYTRDYSLEMILKEIDVDHKYQFIYTPNSVTIRNK